jgi:predicted Zn-dependent protease
LFTKTLAEIYLHQGDLQEAHRILALLAKRNPLDPEIRRKLDEVSEKLKTRPSGLEPEKDPVQNRIRVLEGWLAKIRERRKP